MTPTERRRRARMLSIRDARRRERRRTLVILLDRLLQRRNTVTSEFIHIPGDLGPNQHVQFRFRTMVSA